MCGFAQSETSSEEWFKIGAELAGKQDKVIWVKSWATTKVAVRAKAVQTKQVWLIDIFI